MLRGEGLLFKSVSGSENPTDNREAYEQETDNRKKADFYPNVSFAIETPSETADEIHNRIKECGCPPKIRKHVDGVKSSAQEGQGGEHQGRNDLQLFPTLCPNPDDKSKKAKGNRCEDQKANHPNWVLDLNGDKDRGCRKDDKTEDGRFGSGGSNVPNHYFKC